MIPRGGSIKTLRRARGDKQHHGNKTVWPVIQDLKIGHCKPPGLDAEKEKYIRYCWQNLGWVGVAVVEVSCDSAGDSVGAPFIEFNCTCSSGLPETRNLVLVSPCGNECKFRALS